MIGNRPTEFVDFLTLNKLRAFRNRCDRRCRKPFRLNRHNRERQPALFQTFRHDDPAPHHGAGRDYLSAALGLKLPQASTINARAFAPFKPDFSDPLVERFIASIWLDVDAGADDIGLPAFDDGARIRAISLKLTRLIDQRRQVIGQRLIRRRALDAE